ncbi:DUF2203 domain-containing protein [uncultured Paludibaculum sp.]|uniref:DUF2203 domain-containing protein n=1 Tax=uncultured Paludibaculum sp. TaxID=1765020 RepID=UPI002AAB76A4|nr:DUF2203 domain-containing protein [uncultured Paludibaculum sp.]
MARYFTLEQAQSLVPEVRRMLTEAVEARAELEESQQEIAESMKRAHQMGGVELDTERLVMLRKRVGELGGRLKDILQQFEELGVQVKDLNVGLVDFPTKYRGEEVLICYQLNETGVGYWHGLEEGFRGRKRIDRDFLDHHQGDPVH